MFKKIKFGKKSIILFGIFISAVLVYAGSARLSKTNESQNEIINPDSMIKEANVVSDDMAGKGKEKIDNKLKNPPEEIKALYLTGWSAGSAKKMDGVIELIEKEKLNAVVIDIKDYSGYVSYNADVEEVEKYKARQTMIKDVDSLIKKLHEKNIYAVARITAFQDPVLAKARPDLAVKNKSTGGVWRDNKGLAWIDPASREAWDYLLKIAKDASKKGFDEINFDYIRFPSDGSLRNIAYPFYDAKSEKHEVIAEFFSYLNENLPDDRISADLFGLATVNKDDLGIGQVIEDAYANFDYVCPMVYPSHYASGFQGYKNPAAYPYEVVKYSIDKAKKRLDEFNNTLAGEDKGIKRKAKLRPWLQAFDMGGSYGPERIKSQVKASNESGGTGWILWNSSNNYASRARGIND